jgi:hypothetical protein
MSIGELVASRLLRTPRSSSIINGTLTMISQSEHRMYTYQTLETCTLNLELGALSEMNSVRLILITVWYDHQAKKNDEYSKFLMISFSAFGII